MDLFIALLVAAVALYAYEVARSTVMLRELRELRQAADRDVKATKALLEGRKVDDL